MRNLHNRMTDLICLKGSNSTSSYNVFLYISHNTYHHPHWYKDLNSYSDLNLDMNLVLQVQNHTMDHSLWIERLAVPVNHKKPAKQEK